MVRQFLIETASNEGPFDRLRREEARLRDSIDAFRASDRLGRDEIHER